MSRSHLFKLTFVIRQISITDQFLFIQKCTLECEETNISFRDYKNLEKNDKQSQNNRVLKQVSSLFEWNAIDLADDFLKRVYLFFLRPISLLQCSALR